jgi:hypothetical protein
MVKILCPKCEAKKVYLILIVRGNVARVNMNLFRTSFLSIYERSMEGDRQMVPSGTEQSEHLIKNRF